jgi:hypothetical protein
VNSPDQVMVEIGRGIELQQRGEREAARMLFADIWSRIGADGDPLHRCALAHSMADVQELPEDELCWDLRALDAADSISDDRARMAGIAGTVAVFFPSLHLNLGDVYRRLGDLDNARKHLTWGREWLPALGDDGYAAMIVAGLDRLASRLPPTGEPP